MVHPDSINIFDGVDSMKQITCGLVIMNEQSQILMGKVTGQTIYDLPKGRIEDGETPYAAMCRETYEEFGLSVFHLGTPITDLGEHPYNREKRIHLYLTHVKKDSINLDHLYCSTYFPHHLTGIETPEINGYAWIDMRMVNNYCGKSMSAVLNKMLGSAPKV